MGIFLRALGFILGALGTMLLTLGLNLFFAGAWMPLAFFGIIASIFIWHPRFSATRASSALIFTYALIGLAIWMLSAPIAPSLSINYYRAPLPGVFAACGILSFLVFIYRNVKNPDRLSWIASVIFLLLGWTIFRFSGEKGGADSMVQFVMNTFGIGQHQAELFIVILRKTIHFTGYGIVALNAFHLANPKFDLRRAAIFGLLIALSMGCFDEWSQSLATNRSASPWDVGLDMLGASTFVGLSVLRYRRKMQPSASAERLPGWPS